MRLCVGLRAAAGEKKDDKISKLDKMLTEFKTKIVSPSLVGLVVADS